ncbi:cysteine-rich CWC family protein [Herminiimonas sp. CN]|uniref:cysteine-rich CWC family protein n=1 Tax=Herminiimonas sp. CN TaxID=1349818 RepID=UPI0009E03A8B|nr:cysteine-rich CWC family protein [Herminiimonas sp. CN]
MSLCTRCGAPFACGMLDRHDSAPCWCSQLPALPAAAIDAAAGADARCLCPACLHAAVAALPPAPASLP